MVYGSPFEDFSRFSSFPLPLKKSIEKKDNELNDRGCEIEDMSVFNMSGA